MDETPAPIGARRAVIVLGITQTIGYGCSSYLPASLADSMAGGVGASSSMVFGCVSAAMFLQAFIAPRFGRAVDSRGCRNLLSGASLLLAAGLVGLSFSQTLWQLALAWVVIGFGMASGLYDIAFAGLVGWFGAEARRSITGVTLIAGFASTIAWPLTAYLEHHLGWRGACQVWAAINLIIALPLHLSLPRDRPHAVAHSEVTSAPEVELDAFARRQMILLALALAVMAGVGSIMAAHLPRLLTAMGATASAAIAAGMLVGPAQVIARFGEFLLVRHIHPLVSGRISLVMFPLGAAALLLAGPGAGAVFAILYGAGNGLFTIVRGTLPLALFGSKNYGGRLGTLNIPSRIIGALAPVIFAVGLERSVSLSLSLLIALTLLAFGCMIALRRPAEAVA